MGAHINVFHVNEEEKLLAFHRWQEGGLGDDVIVVANFANQAQDSYSIGLPRAGVWQVRLNSDDQMYDASFGNHVCLPVVAARMRKGHDLLDGMSCWGNVTIGPYGVLVLSQEKE
jgi:1,4-alpha-glucan branching enzyme